VVTTKIAAGAVQLARRAVELREMQRQLAQYARDLQSGMAAELLEVQSGALRPFTALIAAAGLADEMRGLLREQSLEHWRLHSEHVRELQTQRATSVSVRVTSPLTFAD
jgi:hypothetical protein